MLMLWLQETTAAVAQETALEFDWVAGLGTLFALLAVVTTIFYGEIQRRGQRVQRGLAEEQLQLAREQAQTRPILRASFGVRRDSGGPDELRVEVTNQGDLTAHNMRCWIHLRTDSFGPWKPPRPARRDSVYDNLLPIPPAPSLRPERSWGYVKPREQEDGREWSQIQVYERDKLLPGSRRVFDVPIGLFVTDRTNFRYSLVCDEGRMADEEFELVVPAREVADETEESEE